jgi:ribonuclease P/MRP protein subunit POP5
MGQKNTLKPVLPTLRERKRYIVYEIISEHNFNIKEISKSILESVEKCFGCIGSAKAGILFPADNFNENHQKGIIRVSHKEVDNVRFALMTITKINNTKVIFRTIGVSGILKKAKNKFMKTEGILCNNQCHIN